VHDGHVAYFTEAAGLGLPVLCNVTGDAYVSTKHPPLLAQDARARLIDALRAISYTHVSDLATHEVLESLRPRYFAKGTDWKGRLPAEEVAICDRVGIEVVYLDTVLASSSQILSRWTEPLERRSHGRT
jgi:bifunctional ADP-heptose synthase (sugar kinase/adenylyltransferase)